MCGNIFYSSDCVKSYVFQFAPMVSHPWSSFLEPGKGEERVAFRTMHSVDRARPGRASGPAEKKKTEPRRLIGWGGWLLAEILHYRLTVGAIWFRIANFYRFIQALPSFFSSSLPLTFCPSQPSFFSRSLSSFLSLLLGNEQYSDVPEPYEIREDFIIQKPRLPWRIRCSIKFLQYRKSAI